MGRGYKAQEAIILLARSSAGEHYLDTVGVAGSIPVEPTINFEAF